VGLRPTGAMLTSSGLPARDNILRIRLALLAHRITAHLDAMGAVNETIENTFG